MGGDFKMDSELVRLKVINHGDLEYTEFLELASGVGKYDPATLYVIDQRGPVYSIVHPVKEIDKTITILTRWIDPLPEEENLIVRYCKERCALRNDCIKNCALIEYKELSKL